VRETNDADQIKTAMEGFTEKVYQIFGKIYQQQQAEGQADPNAYSQETASNENDDGSVDADFDVK
ncbi:molecular chaperone DnaK, partial [Eubacteriales bacterium OttesenSCG-928-A19]|nr:molecular chaperone DnaK [Eubacteriales bacterium OttesenSCG-928-A19]